MEGAAPPATSRIKALQDLHRAGIKTYSFVGPLLPYFSARKDKLEEIFAALKSAGVNEIFAEHLNLSSKIRDRLFGYLAKCRNLIPYFQKTQFADYRTNLEAIIYGLAEKYKIKIIGAKVINHSKSII
jgi:DNA repair photolyase